MATYGVTPQGFILKRLQDILNDQRAKAVELFQDQVAPGDVVDTSDSSVLGRLINMDSSGDADLWEVAQLVYSAFDPNSATGIALDNLVAYTGISRQEASYSTAIGLFEGDNGTLLNTGQTVKAPVTGNEFVTTESIALSPTQAAGIKIVIGVVSNNKTYTITYTTSSSTSSSITYTSDSSATQSEILNGLLLDISNNHPLIAGSITNNILTINKTDIFQASAFTVTSNISITKVRKTGQIQAVNVGPVSQEANTITEIVTPVLGWDSVTNPLATSEGRYLETDEELRTRFRETKLERSSNILDSLYSALNNIEGVEEVAIYENDTGVTDSNGVPGHSFLPVVLGGSGQIIAETIWENKPMGILSHGNTTVTIYDTQGFPHDINFDRPNPITIYITINLTTDSTIFPATGPEDIKQAIIDYADANFGVGDDIIYTRLYTPINSIPGHQVDSMFIGTSPSPPGTSNIPIAFNAIGSFESVNIQVNI